MTPWWSETAGTYIGAIGGAGLGSICGIYGALMGVLAPKGRARGVMMAAHMCLLGIGIVALVAGMTAVLLEQPHQVYFPLLLIGGVLTPVMGGLLPVVRKRYADAERRAKAEGRTA